MKKHILYLSYDGILEPIGYANVFQYLEKLSVHHNFTLITFEKKHDLKKTAQQRALKQRCKALGIRWYPLRYHKWPALFSTLYDLAIAYLVVMIVLLKGVITGSSIKVIHLRGYVLGAILPWVLAVFRCQFIFDIRGFWADEKHDRAGWSKSSPVYKVFKRLEVYLMAKADVIVSLTDHAKRVIETCFKGKAIQKDSDGNNKVVVIRTCTDSRVFYPQKQTTKSLDKGLIFGYLGSIDTAYCFEDVLRFFRHMLDCNPQHKLQVLTRSDISPYTQLIDSLNIPKDSLMVKAVSRDALNEAMNHFDISVFSLKENFSVKASMPTKVGELLACGIPIMCNAFNDDIVTFFDQFKVGKTLDFKHLDGVETIVDNLLKDSELPNRARRLVNEEFCLEKAVEEYTCLYKGL